MRDQGIEVDEIWKNKEHNLTLTKIHQNHQMSWAIRQFVLR